MMGNLDRFNEKLSETLDNGFKKVNEPLERASEGIKETLNENGKPGNKKIKDSKKETELKEDNSILLPANKNNSHKENIQTMEVTTKKSEYLETKTKEIRKIHRKKIINTREELEMMKNGLLEMFNIPINGQNEIMKFKNNRRNLLEPLEGNHYKIVCNRISRSCLLYTSRCV